MIREDMIHKLEQVAPIVTQVTGTMDMGFEFSAVVPDGVIYAEPGMLLNYSGGQWPPSQWESTEDEEYEKLLRIPANVTGHSGDRDRFAHGLHAGTGFVL